MRLLVYRIVHVLTKDTALWHELGPKIRGRRSGFSTFQDSCLAYFPFAFNAAQSWQ
jgi:hypothetical protein